ncbi:MULTISPECIES: acetyl-CoA hydrolase/transferase family protein [Petrotoga]|uniref:Acyl-CoA hydrolase n=2 Tax=Petrotoga sibirica TaxID=156202 RepID=A0A4V3GP80_9BACT|nr:MULTISPECIES: acetyl-CoA hydrolase/transferase C-terminal domain-containing protein [Petrotoga]KUK83214.1 MAG: Acetyl-CoA hydrolase [Petrotoga mobilis]POZ88998.1 acetyl-CoA hydrolase [Petrotoga sibirica DSM 13575]POZ91407.1 acetyl-CoA hydrolase [Petrotoga sp. SL27]TDX10103.1 acyl-CoA hydrolase [Petrotoga sibirica]
MWKEKYKQKLMSIDDAILSLPKRVSVVVSMAAAEGQGFLKNVHKFKDHFEKIKVITCLDMGHYEFFLNKEYEGTFELQTWFFSEPTRKSKYEDKLKIIDYIPNNLHMAGLDKVMAEKEEGNTLVFWGTSTPMREKTGYFNLGISNVYEKDLAENADIVVMEVNEKMPFVHGDTEWHINNVNVVVESNWEIPEIPISEPKEEEKKIAQYIADIIEDGSTLQIGIGGIPNAVGKLLETKKDLGIHTEMLTESMIDLFEKGVITNMRKSLWKGKFVIAFALGTKRMYEFIDDNPGIFELRGRFVNDPYVVCQNDNMVSLNTAISLDLTGQVVSEAIGTKQFSGTGGQLDTHRGAIKSKNGKGIIALRSTAKKGSISTIVPMLPQGAPITVPRQDLDYVVTEWGVAHLRGRSAGERAKKLISISHPDFRKELEQEAIKMGLI